MKYKARLEKLSPTSVVRTLYVDGFALPPLIGHSFYILAKGLTKGFPYRHVCTSPVVSIKQEKTKEQRVFTVVTESSSLYAITIFGDLLSESHINQLLINGEEI